MNTELPKSYQTYLTTGFWQNTYWNKQNNKPDRSRIEYTIIYKLISLCYSTEDIQSYFETYAYKNSKYRTHGLNRFYNDIKKAKVHYLNNRSCFDKEADLIIQNCYYFKNLLSSDIYVLREIVRTAKKVGKFENIHISQNLLSEKTNICQKTISNSIQRLLRINVLKKEKNYIVQKKPNEYSICSKYLLNAIEKIPYTHKEDVYINDLSEKVKKELKKSGEVIYAILFNNKNKKFDVKEIQKLTGISYPTILKKLDILKINRYIIDEKCETETKPKKKYYIKGEI